MDLARAELEYARGAMFRHGAELGRRMAIEDVKAKRPFESTRRLLAEFPPSEPSLDLRGLVARLTPAELWEGAKALGAGVCATAGSDEKGEACVALGAEAACSYRETDFVEEMRAKGGADLILDMVGGPYTQRNLRALADDGTLVQIAFLQGPKMELNLVQLMTRRLTITGSTLRPQSDLAKARIAEALRQHVWPLIAAGKVAPVMDQEFALEDAAAAHARMESSAHIGKLVLRVA